MNYKFFTFLTTCFLGSVVSFAQNANENIKVTYKTDFIIDFEKIKDGIPADQRVVFKQEIDEGISLDFQLESNGKMSVFKPELKVNNSQGNIGLIKQMIIDSEANPLYKDYQKNLYYNQKEFGGKMLLIKDNLYNYNWKLTKETEDINGFPAVKATGVDEDGAIITAWYSKSLHYKDGPYKFSNLPGLIVKAEFETNGMKAIFTLKDIQVLDKDLIVKLPSKGQVVTMDEFMLEAKKLNKKYSEANQSVDTSK